eukprot:Colp12_sorted_trinity150504_noHs@18134
MRSYKSYQKIGKNDEYRYDPTKIVGSGSFAVVYKGFHASSKSREVAIKHVRKEKLNEKDAKYLESEIAILKRTNHRNIVKLYDVLRAPNALFLVMEYCNAGDLSKYIKRNGKLSEDETKHFFQQLAAGLEFMRAHDIIHRDLKPQNILLSDGAKKDPADPRYLSITLKIADFGFARYLPMQDMAATMCGSPLYMAPEILKNNSYDGKADLWSVGTIIYECITGSAPFKASNHMELCKKIELSKDNISYPEHISASLKDLLSGLLKQDPLERISFPEFFMHPYLDFENYERPCAYDDESTFSAAAFANPDEEIPGVDLGVADSSTEDVQEQTLSESPDAAILPNLSSFAVTSAAKQSQGSMHSTATEEIPFRGRANTTPDQNQSQGGLSSWRRSTTSGRSSIPTLHSDPMTGMTGASGVSPPGAATFAVPMPLQPDTSLTASRGLKAPKTSPFKPIARPTSGSSSQLHEDEYVMVDKDTAEVNIMADALSTAATQTPNSKGGPVVRAMAGVKLQDLGINPALLARAVAQADDQQDHMLADLERAENLARTVMELAEARGRSDNSAAGSGNGSASFDKASSSTRDPLDALVLYVKALQVLHQALKSTRELVQQGSFPLTPASNDCVQRLRGLYNVCLEQTDALKSHLRPAYPTHGLAERLMYQNALSGCQNAAMNELLGQMEDAEREYQRSLVLLEGLANAEGTPESDKNVLRSYVDNVRARLRTLRNRSALSTPKPSTASTSALRTVP